MPALRPVSTSTEESPTIIAFCGAVAVSFSSVFTPSGSGFLVSKLLPPYTRTKNGRGQAPRRLRARGSLAYSRAPPFFAPSRLIGFAAELAEFLGTQQCGPACARDSKREK